MGNQLRRSEFSPALTGVTQVAAGGYQALALLSNGTVAAWGYNEDGQTTVPASVNANGDIVAVAAGNYESMALHADGTVSCWGEDTYGECDIPSTLHFKSISGGEDFFVGVLTSGSIYLQGNNLDGQLVAPPGNDFVSVKAGSYFVTAMTTSGTLVTFGTDNYGELNSPSGVYDVYSAAGAAESPWTPRCPSRRPWACWPPADCSPSIAAAGEKPCFRSLVALCRGQTRTGMRSRRSGSLIKPAGPPQSPWCRHHFRALWAFVRACETVPGFANRQSPIPVRRAR